MSLPLVQRPEAALAELEEKKRDLLKIDLDKEKLFLASFGAWCVNLSHKQKKRLTRKVLLRRALYEAHRLNYDIDFLPKNWLKNLLAEHDVILYKKRKNVDVSSSSKSGKYEQNKSGKVDSPSKVQGTARTVTAALLRLTGTGAKTVKEENVTEDKQDAEDVGETKEKEENGGGTEGKLKPKKMIDLSNEPPPGWWLQSYAKGIVLPRLLQISSTSTQTIIFWDYEVEPTKQEGSEKYEMRPHDRLLKFDWWAKETKEKEKLKLELERSSTGSTTCFKDPFRK